MAQPHQSIQAVVFTLFDVEYTKYHWISYAESAIFQNPLHQMSSDTNSYLL